MDLQEREFLAKIEAIVNDRCERLEAQFNTQEEIIANLMMGFGELSVGLEQLMIHFLETLPPDDRIEFVKDINEKKNELVSLFDRLTHEAVTTDISGDTAPPSATLESMARGDESPLD